MNYNHIVDSQFYPRKFVVLVVTRECVFHVNGVRMWTSTRGEDQSYVNAFEQGKESKTLIFL